MRPYSDSDSNSQGRRAAANMSKKTAVIRTGLLVAALILALFIPACRARVWRNLLRRPRFGPHTGVTIDTTQYYDDRKAAVIFTADDWSGDETNHQAFLRTCKLARKYGVVVSPGLIPGLPGHTLPCIQDHQWDDIQSQIDAGSVSPVSHSMTHPGKDHSYTDRTSYWMEVGGSKQTILGKLAFPQENWFNNLQYLAGWLEPYGKSDGQVKNMLRNCQYLVSRDTALGQFSWGSWDDTYSMYFCGLTTDLKSLSLVNGMFEQVLRRGGIYHFNIHPAKYDWPNDDTLERHLRHIGLREDVWYVGFGPAYMYRYVVEKVKPTIKIAKVTRHSIFIHVSIPVKERNKYGLSYPITYRVCLPDGWSSVLVYVRDAAQKDFVAMTTKTNKDLFNGIDAYRIKPDVRTVYVSKAFPKTSSDFFLKIEKPRSPTKRS